MVRKERLHPGAQLRFSDADSMRLACFATNTASRAIAGLELRVRAAGRIRATGVRNLPLHDTAEPDLAGDHPDRPGPSGLDAPTRSDRNARLWEPRRLRLRLFSTAAQLVTTGPRRYLRLARHWPWTDVITEAQDRLHTLPNPG